MAGVSCPYAWGAKTGKGQEANKNAPKALEQQHSNKKQNLVQSCMQMSFFRIAIVLALLVGVHAQLGPQLIRSRALLTNWTEGASDGGWSKQDGDTVV